MALPPPSAARGLGCVAKGVLAVVILLVLFGGLGWYTMWSFAPFLSQQQEPTRTFPATDAQYQAVTDKIAPFFQMVSQGHAATLVLTADDLNILVARDPSYAMLRGKTYLSIVHNILGSETALPVSDDGPDSQKFYFRGRAFFDASFTSGDFTLGVRRVEPLDGGPTPSLVAWFVSQESFSRGISREVNETFHDALRGNPRAAALFGRVRTIIVRDNQLVVMALEAPSPVASPPVSR